jgi:H/ACA ribonucleoprotein complex subunit 3
LRNLMFECADCHRYTLEEKCPACGGSTVSVHPARYSPDDRYARYRNPGAYEARPQTT